MKKEYRSIEYYQADDGKVKLGRYDASNGEHWFQEFGSFEDFKKYIDNSFLTIMCEACNKSFEMFEENWENFLYYPGGGLLTCPHCSHTGDEFNSI